MIGKLKKMIVSIANIAMVLKGKKKKKPSSSTSGRRLDLRWGPHNTVYIDAVL